MALMTDEPQRIRVPASDSIQLSAIGRPRDPAAEREGAPVLLVHGLASNARLWDDVALELARRGHPTVAVDLRGHGLSDKPDEGYDFATITADLLAVLDALALERPIVAGQSWGGNVALELGARHADRVRGVIGVDGGTIDLATEFPRWEDCAAAQSPPPLIGTPLVQLERHIRSAHPDWPETGIRGSLGNFEVRADGTVAPWLTRERHMRILRALWEQRPRELYQRIGVPVLLLPAEGSQDRPDRIERRRRSIEAAEAAIPTVRVRWFRPADHDLHAQKPIECATVIADAAAEGFFGR
jgi:pimeloyl-ACP methyl ester carboxylesterase